LRAEKAAFSSRAVFVFSLRWIAVTPCGKKPRDVKFRFSRIDSAIRRRKPSRTGARVVGCMSAIADADAAPPDVNPRIA